MLSVALSLHLFVLVYTQKPARGQMLTVKGLGVREVGDL